MKQKLVFLVGPTAGGKTALSLSLAPSLNAEIISCDSMQVYRGMEILTSQPSPEDRRKVPHHLVGVISPAEDFNVSRYRARAMNAARGILEKGNLPLFVGGSGLYMSVIVDGIFRRKTEDPSVRRRLEKRAASKGPRVLYERLEKVDPLAAGRIHPNDCRRIIRALEVFEVSGKPISELQRLRKGLWDKFEIHLFCLDLPRNVLYARIDERVDRMFESGVVEETRRLLRRPMGKTAGRAIGIGEIRGYLEGGCGIEEARRLMKRNTRLYAKRQLTWFRKDKRIVWVGYDGKNISKARGRIIAALKGRSKGNKI